MSGAYDSRESIPEATLDALVGPGKRYEVCWYSLPKLAGPGEHKGRCPVWHSIYGEDALKGERLKR